MSEADWYLGLLLVAAVLGSERGSMLWGIAFACLFLVAIAAQLFELLGALAAVAAQ